MPTMRSIGVHVRDRLASLGEPVPPGPSDSAHHQQQQQQHLPIRTPQALLSRDPSQVAAGIGVTLPEVLNLRADVADAMTMTEGEHGRDATVLVAEVSKAIGKVGRSRKRRRSQRRGVGGDGGGGGSDEENSKAREEEEEGLFHARRPPPVVLGAVTALDMCIHSALLSAESPALSTGSVRLDALLAPPADLADGGPSTRVYHSSVLPKVGFDTNSNDDGAAAFFGPEFAPSQAGVRPGYVSEVYGPPSSGKTQLALTLTANAAVGGWTVHYLAGGGGSGTVLPLARRLKFLCTSRLSAARGGSNGNSTGLPPAGSSPSRAEAEAALFRALERVVFSTVQDGHRALAVLAGIERDARPASPQPISSGGVTAAPSGSVGKNNVLIVLDSASGCLSSDLYADGDGGVGAALVNDVGLKLRRMARNVARDGGRCAVFVVNGTVSSSSSSSVAITGSSASSAVPSRLLRHKPALGMGWRAADVLLQFDVVGDDCPPDGQWEGTRQAVPGLVTSSHRTVRATLVKHCSKSVSARGGVDAISAKFGVTAGGIVDN